MTARLLSTVATVILLAVWASGCVTTTTTVSVPVEVRSANNIGAIGFELAYDSTLLEVTEVDDVGFSESADAGYNSDTPGRLVVVVENASINGDGTLVEVNFKALQDSGESAVTFERIEARNATTGELVTTQTEAGSIRVDDESYVSPKIVFGQ